MVAANKSSKRATKGQKKKTNERGAKKRQIFLKIDLEVGERKTRGK